MAVARRRPQRDRPDHHLRRRRTFKVRIAGLVKDFDSPTTSRQQRELRTHLARAGRFGVAAAIAGARATPASAGRRTSPTSAASRSASSVGRPELQDLADMFHRDQRRARTSTASRRRWCSSATRTSRGGHRRARRLPGPDDQRQHRLHGVRPRDRRGLPPHPGRRGEADARRRLRLPDDLARRARLLAARRADRRVQRRSGARVPAVRPRPLRASCWARARSSRCWRSGRRRVARGAHIYAEVAGYGSSLNAYRITDAPPDGGGAILAMDERAARVRARHRRDRLRRRARHRHAGQRPQRDARDQDGLRRRRLQARDQLAEVDDRAPDRRVRRPQPARRLSAPCATAIVPPTINLDNPDPSSTSTMSRTGARERRCARR